jgi:hypothetical protein
LPTEVFPGCDLKVSFGIRFTSLLFVFFLAVGVSLTPCPARAQDAAPAAQPGESQQDADATAARKALAEKQIKAQEHQRILGIVPEFNISNV